MIAIREAHPGDPRDAAAVARLARHLGYPTDEDQARRRIERLSASPDDAALVADLDGAAVGWIHVAVRKTLESEPCAEIVGLVVDESHRGKAIGAALVDAAVDWARDRGLAELRVRSNVVRERAHRFYERQGFLLLKEQKVFRRDIGGR